MHYVPLAITFTGKTNGLATEWNVNLGALNPSTEQNPVFQYGTARNSLTTKDARVICIITKKGYGMVLKKLAF